MRTVLRAMLLAAALAFPAAVHSAEAITVYKEAS